MYTWVLAMICLASFLKLNYMIKSAILLVMVIVYTTLMVVAYPDVFNEVQVKRCVVSSSNRWTLLSSLPKRDGYFIRSNGDGNVVCATIGWLRPVRRGQMVNVGAYLPFLLRCGLPFSFGRGDFAAGFPLETAGGQGVDRHIRNANLQHSVAQKHFTRSRGQLFPSSRDERKENRREFVFLFLLQRGCRFFFKFISMKSL